MQGSEPVTPRTAVGEKGSLVLGRYRIGDQVGQGGMGWVYQATDEVLKRDVAIKVLKQDVAGDPETLERFRREASIAASLSHPGIAQVLDFAEEEGSSFLILELLRGRDLARVLAEEGPMEFSRAAEIARSVADALEHAHERGAVHRDVKPANIFLTDSGTVKVTDFGIATAAEQSSLTKTGDILGTAFYLSPEQVRGMPATPASDVYALGCVLFEMVTGRPPFSAETSVATALARLDKPPPQASDFVDGVPAALEGVIRRALAAEAADRYPSAAAMADALQGVLGPATARMAQPAGARTEVLRPTAAVERSVEKIKESVEKEKRPWIAVAAVAVGLLILVLLARSCATNQTPAPVSLPSVVSLPFEEAKARLEKEGFAVRRGPDELSDQPAGRVFRQTPPAGTASDKGATVTLSVSSGQGVKVPSLVGMSLTDAARDLEKAGLTGIVTSRVDGPQSGIVSAQDPVAGTMITPDTRINLTVTQQAARSRDGEDGKDGQDGEPGGAGERGKGSDKKDD